MADINVQELARALAAIARQSDAVSGRVRTASEILADFEDPLRASLKNQEKYIDRLKQLNSDEAKRRVELLETLKNPRDITQKELSARRKEVENIDQAIEDTKKALRRQREAAKKAEQQYGKTDDITAKAYDQMNDLKQQMADLRASKKKATDAEKDATSKVKNFNSAMDDQVKALKTISWKEAASNTAKAMQQGIMDGIKRVFSGVSIAAGLESQFTSMIKEYQTGINLGTMMDAMDFAKYGLSPGEMADLAKSNRRGVIAGGGPGEIGGLMEDVAERMKNVLPSQDVGEYTMKQLQTLANAGIKPSIASMQSLNKAYDVARKAYGQTGPEFAAVMNELVTSQELQSQLSVLGAAERQAMMDSISLRYAENAAMGLSIEQSKKILLQQSKEAMRGPLANIRDAVRQMALGAAMGVNVDPRYLQESMKAPGKRDETFITSTRMKIRGGIESATSGEMGDGMRFLAEQAIPKLDKQGILGPENTMYSTAIAEVAKLTPENTNALGELNDTSKSLINVLTEVRDTLNKAPIAQVIGGSVTGLIGIIGSLGATIMSAAALMAVSRGSGINVGGGRGGRGGKLKGAMGAVKGAGKMVPFLGAGLAIGSGVNDIASGNAGAGWGTMIGTGVGALAGSALGPVGTIAGGAAGGAIGEYVGGMFDGEKASEAVQPADTTGKALMESSARQIKQMDENNEYLKQVAEVAPKLVELAEKQLVALTTTEQMRTSEATRARLLSGTRFSPQYNTL
jgi:hypothetical protein